MQLRLLSRLHKMRLLSPLLAALAPLCLSGATYYIDNNGLGCGGSGCSDSNNGITKATAWAHHPGMPGWAGSYSHSNGDSFIFRGGDTWLSSNLPLTPSSGGAPGNYDYYGVDPTWYIGGGWSRPIFDDQLTDNIQAVFQLKNLSNITVDNLEFRQMYTTQTSYNFALVYCSNSTNITIENSYLHGWKSAAANDATQHGGIFGGNSGMLIQNNIIENSLYGDNGVGITNSTGIISGNLIHDMPTGMIGIGGTISGNIIYNIDYPVADFDPTYHTNGIYLPTSTGSAYVFNNLIYNIQAGTVLYLEPCWSGGTGVQYVFNNVIYADSLSPGGGGMILVSNEGGTGTSCGTTYIWGNTTETENTNGIRITGSQSSTPLLLVVVENNHNINDSAGVLIDGVSPITITQTTNLTMSHATATGQGYVAGNHYASSAATNSTVRAGTNLTGLCSGVGASLCSATIIGGLVNPIARPSSGAWDIGAYQFVTLGTSLGGPLSIGGP